MSDCNKIENSSCRAKYNAKCIIYRGPNLPCIDVFTNDSLYDALININKTICEFSPINIGGQNLGSGHGIFASMSGNTLQFKSLVAGGGINISHSGSEITITNSGGGGGGSAWLLEGNSSTDPLINFIGTTDSQDFVIKTNNVERARILSTGEFGINTSTPTSLFHIVKNNIITTPSNTDGIFLQNTTAATALIPVQMSPPIVWQGRVWETAFGGSNRNQSWKADIFPFQQSGFGRDAYWQLAHSENGGSYVTHLKLSDRGNLEIFDLAGTKYGSFNSNFIGKGNLGGIYWTNTNQPPTNYLTITGSDNTASGLLALFNITSGSYNSVFGSTAGLSLTTSELNSFFGYQSGYNVTTGNGQNSFFGTNSGLFVTTGFKNTFIGAGAGENTTTGQENTFIGQDSGLNNIDGIYNVYIGVNAKGGAGAVGNIILGYYAGVSLGTTNQDNIFIGRIAGNHASQKTDAVNSIAIGYNAYTTADNQIVWGNSSHTSLRIPAYPSTRNDGSTTKALYILNANGDVGYGDILTSTDTNFANTDLTLNADRNHDGNGFSMLLSGFDNFEINASTVLNLVSDGAINIDSNGDITTIGDAHNHFNHTKLIVDDSLSKITIFSTNLVTSSSSIQFSSFTNGYLKVDVSGNLSVGTAGTVSSFSAGNLSPLFTTSVSNATTTPSLSFAQINQSANLVFAGPSSGGAASPTFRSLVVNDIPTLTSAKISDFNEAAQDAVGGILTDTNTVDLVYTDVSDQITANVVVNGVDNTLTQLLVWDGSSIFQKDASSIISSLGVVSGKVIWVDKDSPNATDSRGSYDKHDFAHPFLTIQEALNNWADGDTIIILPGIYTESTLIFNNVGKLNLIFINVELNTEGIDFSGGATSTDMLDVNLINSNIINSGTASIYFHRFSTIRVYGNQKPNNEGLNASSITFSNTAVFEIKTLNDLAEVFFSNLSIFFIPVSGSYLYLDNTILKTYINNCYIYSNVDAAYNIYSDAASPIFIDNSVLITDSSEPNIHFHASDPRASFIQINNSYLESLNNASIFFRNTPITDDPTFGYIINSRFKAQYLLDMPVLSTRYRLYIQNTIGELSTDLFLSSIDSTGSVLDIYNCRFNVSLPNFSITTVNDITNIFDNISTKAFKIF